MFAQVTGFRKFNTQKSFIKNVCWEGQKTLILEGVVLWGWRSSYPLTHFIS